MEHIHKSVQSIGSRLIASVNYKTTALLHHATVLLFCIAFRSDKVTFTDTDSCKVLLTYAGAVI